MIFFLVQLRPEDINEYFCQFPSLGLVPEMATERFGVGRPANLQRDVKKRWQPLWPFIFVP